MAAPTTRNLTIVLTDIKGFTDKTSHKSRVEIQTLLDRHKEIVWPVLEARGGHLVKTMGDAFLATFESPTNAVLAGMEAQAALAVYNMGRKAEDRIEIRVAINQGEVNVVDNDIFGEPVNITARIEAVADAGDVFFTEAIYLAMNKKEVPSSEVGLLQLKGIPEKVRVYRVKLEHPVEAMGSAAAYLAERAPAPAEPAAAPAAPDSSSGTLPVIGAAVFLACAAASALYVRGAKGRLPATSASAPSAASVPPAADVPRAAPVAAAPRGSIAARVDGRTYPSVLYAWERPGTKTITDPLAYAAKLARRDLIYSGPYTFRLKWRGAYQGLGEEFTPESVAAGLDVRREILARNPNAVLLLGISYDNYGEDYLPPEHAWWMRDARGGHIQAWKAGYSKLDYRLKAFQEHVAAQCRAAVRSGVLDGCMLNSWQEDDDHLSLLKKVRAAAGEDAVLLVSASQQLPLSAPLLNGQLISIQKEPDAQAWGSAATAMTWAQAHLRSPRLVSFLLQQDKQSPELLRLATTLALTHSDGYVLYAQPPGNGEGWSDEWPSFWNKALGRPLEAGEPRDGGSTSREFERGTAVYNPPDAPPAKLAFNAPRTSAATGHKGKTFTLPSGDGDLYLK